MTTPSVDLYDSAYSHHAAQVLAAVRQETYGVDIGQTSWLTADEFQRFWQWLGIGSKSRVLEIGCGSGGSATYMVETTKCHVNGIDINEHGIAAAHELARAKKLEGQAQFKQADASKTLPFDGGIFDAAICIDAIIHIPDRLRLLGDVRRVLRSGGRFLYSDPVTVTGLVSQAEFAIRSSIGYFEFSAPGVNESLIEKAGLRLLQREDATDNSAMVSRRWRDARAGRQAELIRLEGAETYEGMQRFLDVVHRLSSERRLSRYVFVTERPD